jgi:hypothetical protein
MSAVRRHPLITSAEVVELAEDVLLLDTSPSSTAHAQRVPEEEATAPRQPKSIPEGVWGT